jgi:hypothetical protein
MSEPTIRRLVVAAEGTLLRTANFMGRVHMVVPVVALREGVIHAINAASPEFVPASELDATPQGWNGRPVLPLHPVDALSRQISANSPTVLEAHQFGFIANARTEGRMLKMDAWLDKARATELGGDAQRVIARLEEGKPIEVSVGAFVSAEAKEGTHGGKAYKAVWHTIVPDHLAMLPEGTLGACSNEMGCGAPRTAAQQKEDPKPMTMRERVRTLLRGARGTPKAAADGDTAETVQYSTMQLLLDAVTPAYDAAKSLLADLIADDAIEPTMPDDEDAADELESARLESLQSYCMEMIGSLSAVMSLAYKCNREDAPTYMAMAQTLKDLAGKRNSSRDQEMIQTVHDHMVKLGAACAEKLKGAEAAPPCGCGDAAAAAHSEGGAGMEKSTRIAALIACEHNVVKDKAILESLSDQELDALEAFNKVRVAMTANPKQAIVDLVTAPAPKVAEVKPEEKPEPDAKKEPEPKVAAAEVSEEEYLKTAPDSIRQLVADKKASDAAEKTALVTSLKDAQQEFTEVELQAMDLKALGRLANVVKVAKPDFSGRGVVRDAGAADVYSTPPDPYAAALEARRKAEGTVN